MANKQANNFLVACVFFAITLFTPLTWCIIPLVISAFFTIRSLSYMRAADERDESLWKKFNRKN